MCMVLVYFKLKIFYIKDIGDSLDLSYLDYLYFFFLFLSYLNML